MYCYIDAKQDSSEAGAVIHERNEFDIISRRSNNKINVLRGLYMFKTSAEAHALYRRVSNVTQK